ncbi:Cytochrome P450 monooxygenase [Paramyrothecium foliicola]|nr:Cytochrome P450 monooxygenase [Paramyrothecium foliicola]
MLVSSVSVSTAVLAIVVAAGIWWLQRLIFPALEPLEPPFLRPKVPIVGHVVSMMREKASFYARLFKENAMPICTLPMLSGKLYIINSPELVQAAMRTQEISFDPFQLEFSVTIFGLNEKQRAIMADREHMDKLLDVIHVNLMGKPLHRINVSALTTLSVLLNNIHANQGLEVPDSYLWLRENMTLATVFALKFDEGAILLALGFAPNLIAPKSVAAREELRKLLIPYYQARHDQLPGVSDIIAKRASALRESGFDHVDLGTQEIMLPWVGTTNTIPTTFWLFYHIFSKPDYVEKVRKEIEAITVVTTESEGTIAEMQTIKLEKSCVFLYACYQETLRVYLHSVGNRRVMNDVKIQDQQGQEYLLRKGINVQWPPNVLHFLDSAWGDDTDTFKPERFINTSSQDERRRRGAYLPFGGGRNLCPGRKFALAEILGFLGALALGFDIEGVELPDALDPPFGQAARQPVWNGKSRGMTIRRRQGWEETTWKFV